ncbi:uncharacterized protein CC84DRAFT_362019 [Paraphaeosphaeria sporulosa]|uniref:Uncharacterized protein n=1 Tax=Paraphaeosphaeria sporulosa TaxID=1460663 RepID=A0A177C0D4_9PLEO|nr:uncharacterized protein CC84DRAFT_362019 [Paraphaeosphaeria sporulosa]OAG00167.1 hypothetical protein CC84DRAFT_362019 [Paraphaeosphaeria sporulosa]
MPTKYTHPRGPFHFQHVSVIHTTLPLYKPVRPRDTKRNSRPSTPSHRNLQISERTPTLFTVIMAPLQNPYHAPLRQIQYRSYLKTIELYHYSHQVLPISRFEEMFAAQTPGFVRRLESRDTLCDKNGQEKNHVPDGDEVPIGFTEVAYLFNIFRNRGSAQASGSALGFRFLDEDRIEWMCFDRPVDNLLSGATANDGRHLFQKVADLERGDGSTRWKGTVGGWPEHRQWCNALDNATRPLLRLTMVERSRARLDERKARDARNAELHSDENNE